MDSAHPYALAAGTIVGGYELRRVLGSGGFGITYEAISPYVGQRRRWAIKEFFPHGFASREDATRLVYFDRHADIIEKALTQFERSAGTLGELDHPHIVKVHHYIKENETGYMVMEYVEGPTLESWMQDRVQQPSFDDLVPVFEKVFDALEYVHSCGSVHRDIAPDNIIVRDGHHPVLIDFGAAKLLNPRTTAQLSSLIVRKRYYSPPEQSETGLEVRPATDVYSLAAILYRAVTGGPPADAEDRTRALGLGRSDPYEPIEPRADLPLPSVARRAIDRALSIRAAERTQTVTAFRDELGWSEAAVPVPEKETPAPAAGVITTTPPRNRARAIALASVAVLAVLAGSAIFGLGSRGPAADACSTEQLEAATSGGEAGLAKFLAGCTAGPQALEARHRLDTRTDEREAVAVRDAGYDIGKLQAYLTQCVRCRDRESVSARIAVIKGEEATYLAATSIEALQSYTRLCKACLHKDAVQRQINSLRHAARVKGDQEAYGAARGSIERLERYASTCDLCVFRSQALSEAETLRKAKVVPPPAPEPRDGAPPADAEPRRRVAHFIEWEHLQGRSDYAASVDYFTRGMVPRDVVLREIAAYRRRWPNQNYWLTPGTLEIAALGDDRYSATFEFTYHHSNSATSAKGRARSQVILLSQGGRFLVAGVKEAILRR